MCTRYEGSMWPLYYRGIFLSSPPFLRIPSQRNAGLIKPDRIATMIDDFFMSVGHEALILTAIKYKAIKGLGFI